MKRKLLITILGLLAVVIIAAAIAGVTVHTDSFRSWFEGKLETVLTEATGRPVSLRIVDLAPLRLRAAVEDFTIGGASPDALPLVSAASIDLDANWSALLRKRADLSSLTVNGLRVDLEQLPLDLPEEDTESPPFSIADFVDLILVDRLEVEDGWLHFGGADVPLDILAEGVALSADFRRLGRSYQGTLSAGAGGLSIPDAGDFPVTLQTGFTLGPDTVTLTDIRLSSTGLSLSGSGELTDWNLPAYRATFEAEVAPGELPVPALAELELGGSATLDGDLEGKGGDLRVTAAMTSRRLDLASVSASDISCRLALADEQFRASELLLDILGARVEGELTAAVAGIAPWSADLQLASDDPDPLVRWLFPESRAGSRGSFAGSLDIGGTAFDLKALAGTLAVRTEDLVLADAPQFPMTLDAEAEFDGGAADISRFTLTGPGASIAGSGTLALDSPSSIEFSAEVARLEPLDSGINAVAGLMGGADALPEELLQLRGRLQVDGELGVPTLKGFDMETLSGRLDLVADKVTLAEAPETVLDARMETRFAGGQIILDRAHAESAGVELDATGGVGMAGASGLGIRATVARLEESLPALRPLLAAFDLPADILDPLSSLSGSLLFDARIDGGWNELDGTAELAVDELASGKQPLGRLMAEATARGGMVEMAGILDGAGGGIEISGAADLGAADGIPARLEVRLDGLSLEPLLTAAGLDLPVSGLVGGDAVATFPGPEVQADLALVDGAAAGIPLDSVTCELLLIPGRLEVTGARVAAAGGALSVSGGLGAGGSLDGLSFKGDGFELGRLVETLETPLDLNGRLSFSGSVTGALEEPRLAASVALNEMSSSGFTVPELDGDLSLDPAGVELHLASPDGLSVARLEFGFGEGDPWIAEVRYPLHLDTRRPLEAGFAPGGFIAAGALNAAFRWVGDELSTLEGVALVEGVRLEADGHRLDGTGPLQVRVASGRAVIEPFRLEGPDTGLDVEGSMTLADSPEAEITARGTVDLGLLRGLDDRLRTEGQAEFDLIARGPVAELALGGVVRLREGRLRHPDFPLVLEKIEAEAVLQPDRWQLSRLEMTAGGGQVTGSGEMSMDGLRVEAQHFELTGRGVRLAYPEGFRSELDADLMLTRENGGPGRLSGEVRIIGGLYDEEINIEKQFLSRTRAADRIASVEPGLLDRVALDLRVTSDDGLWVRNNLASMETGVALQMRGTFGTPDISGRVQVLEGGTVTFRGVDYSIIRGSIDYPGGASTPPEVDLRAETTRSDYDIQLAVTGPLENLKFDLNSTPPLSQTDIVTLLVTGKTRDELGSGGGGLSDDQATIYLSGRLTDSLAPALQRSLGLDEVSVNPVLMGSQADPTARITVGKSLTPRLFVTYSSLMGSDRQDIYQAKYRLTDRLNLLGTRDEDGSLAGDVVYRARLYRGPPREGETAGGGGQNDRKISRIEFRGNRFASAFKLRRQLGVTTRDRYHRSRLLGGLERIRDWYYARGFPEIEVEHQVIEDEDTVDLVITVDEGPQVKISLPGAPRPRRPLRREVYRLWSRSIFREDLLEEGARLVLGYLGGRGYIRATVDPSREEPEPGLEEVVFRVDRGERVRVDELHFTGIHGVEEKNVRSRMLTREAGLLAREGFSPRTLDDDLEAIRNYYATLGFLDAAVKSRVEDLPGGKRVVVTVEIEEGERYRLGPVGFSGNEAFTAEALLAETGLQAGSPFNDEEVRQAERKLAVLYDRQGYGGAAVRSGLRIDRESMVVDVAFEVEEGSKLVVEAVEVVSPGITNPEIIRRELELWAGQPLSNRQAGRSQYNLYRTGLFRSVGYEILPGDTPEGRRVVFTVDESPNLHFDYGIGYNSDFGMRVSGNVAHNNFMGRGLYVGLGGRYGGDDSRAQFVVRNPRLWGSEVEGLVRAYWEEEDRVSYDATRLGGVLQSTRRYHDGRYTLIGGYGLEDLTTARKGLDELPGSPSDQSVDPLIDPRVETEVRLGSLRLDGARDSRDAFLWPTSGSFTRAELGVYDQALLSEAEYLRGFFQWNIYQTLFRSAVWISSVRLGLAQPYGNTEFLPISERFFTGGESSLRGFKYDTLPAVGAPYLPGVESDTSTGGNALFLFNQELTVPVADPIHLLIFYDAGNLYWKVSDFDITDLRQSAGLGIRIRTPVGPLRLEYGWKLDREEGESSGRLHFSFGMPF